MNHITFEREYEKNRKLNYDHSIFMHICIVVMLIHNSKLYYPMTGGNTFAKMHSVVCIHNISQCPVFHQYNVVNPPHGGNNQFYRCHKQLKTNKCVDRQTVKLLMKKSAVMLVKSFFSHISIGCTSTKASV